MELIIRLKIESHQREDIQRALEALQQTCNIKRILEVEEGERRNLIDEQNDGIGTVEIPLT